MSLLDKLSTIVKFDLRRLKNIHLFSDNQTKTYIDKRTIHINISQLGASDNAQVQKIVRDLVEKENTLLIEDEAKKRIEDISSVEKKGDNNEVLKYFKGKVPPTDVEILRAALYIKSVYERGESVRELKWDVIQKYGERGKNIVNLCSAGYFISIIKPLYEEMSRQDGFTQDAFHSTYEKIVTQYTFAVFVNAMMTPTKLKEEVVNKIEINKKYGIKHLNIHGIGSENVSKILELLNELRNTFTQNPEIESGRGFINVKIWF